MDKVLDHACVGSVDTILYWCPIRRKHSVYLSNKQIAFSSRKYKVRELEEWARQGRCDEGVSGGSNS